MWLLFPLFGRRWINWLARVSGVHRTGVGEVKIPTECYQDCCQVLRESREGKGLLPHSTPSVGVLKGVLNSRPGRETIGTA